MASQTWLTVLGGLISGLVGVGLFFLQRFKAGRDEQERILFQIYQLMVLPTPPGPVEDPMARASIACAADEVKTLEIRSLAVRIKDKELAAEICRYHRMPDDETGRLIEKIVSRLNPKLFKLTESGQGAKAAGEQKKI